jgi:hypothetical protein
MRVSIIVVFVLSALSIGYALFICCSAAFAQFNGCALGFCPDSFGSGFSPAGSGGGGAPLVSCPSTGIYNLANVCNDIYFIGALK